MNTANKHGRMVMDNEEPPSIYLKDPLIMWFWKAT